MGNSKSKTNGEIFLNKKTPPTKKSKFSFFTKKSKGHKNPEVKIIIPKEQTLKYKGNISHNHNWYYYYYPRKKIELDKIIKIQVIHNQSSNMYMIDLKKENFKNISNKEGNFLELKENIGKDSYIIIQKMNNDRLYRITYLVNLKIND